MHTVVKKLIVDKWDSRVQIYVIKQFKDDRGMVCETFRVDDELLNLSRMSYISETNAYVMRGPHEHINQKDFFVSWKNRMIYELYNKDTDELFHFITDPDEIYLVRVDEGIVHAYRNLESNTIRTLNYPTSLFMGENKSELIDEIRHEENLKDNSTVIVFGAGGRLGKAMVNSLYTNLGYYKVDIIPIYEKIQNENHLNDLFEKLKSVIKNNKTCIINCCAKTNVQMDSNVFWENVEIPNLLNRKCKQFDYDFIHFSTDYVFQVGNNLSEYTMSKKKAEYKLIEFGYNKTKIFRVSNLFSSDSNDINNILYKLAMKVKNKEKIQYNDSIKILPTNVKNVADALTPFIINRELFNSKFKIFNLIPEISYTIKEFLRQFYDYKNVEHVESNISPWINDYMNSDENIIIPTDTNSIKFIVNNILTT